MSRIINLQNQIPVDGSIIEGFTVVELVIPRDQNSEPWFYALPDSGEQCVHIGQVSPDFTSAHIFPIWNRSEPESIDAV